MNDNNDDNDTTTLPDAMLTAVEVAELVGVSVRSVWRYVRQGVLPEPVRLSRKVSRFRSDAIARVLADRQQQQQQAR